MRTNVVLPVWVPPPEVRPAAGLVVIVQSLTARAVAENAFIVATRCRSKMTFVHG